MSKQNYTYFKSIFGDTLANFWETEPQYWDHVNNVGLRYVI